jgi:hypothetical protein
LFAPESGWPDYHDHSKHLADTGLYSHAFDCRHRGLLHQIYSHGVQSRGQLGYPFYSSARDLRQDVAASNEAVKRMGAILPGFDDFPIKRVAELASLAWLQPVTDLCSFSPGPLLPNAVSHGDRRTDTKRALGRAPSSLPGHGVRLGRSEFFS